MSTGPFQNGLDEVATFRRACELFEKASYQSHSGHWDETMQGGRGCPECLRARALREEAEALLRTAAPLPIGIRLDAAAAREDRADRQDNDTLDAECRRQERRVQWASVGLLLVLLAAGMALVGYLWSEVAP